MINTTIKTFSLIAMVSSTVIAATNWPMSGGPNGNWQLNTDEQVPIQWSVRTGENIKWRTELPEGGQSGIAVWENYVFLTINPETDTPQT